MIKTFVTNAIKYLCRYGKKNGHNRKDLLKAIHYIVLLMSSEDQEYADQMEEDAIKWIDNERRTQMTSKLQTDVMYFKDDVGKNLYRKKTYYTLVVEQDVLANDKDEKLTDCLVTMEE